MLSIYVGMNLKIITFLVKKNDASPKRWGLQLSEYDKGHAYLANKTIDISVAISSRLASFSGFMQGYEDSDRPCMHAV